MARNPVQFQKGLSLIEFNRRYGTDERVSRIASRKKERRADAFNNLAAFGRSGPARSFFVCDVPGLEQLICYELNSCRKVAAWPGRQ